MPLCALLRRILPARSARRSMSVTRMTGLVGVLGVDAGRLCRFMTTLWLRPRLAVGLPDTDTTEAALAKHIATKTTPVVFYCNGVKCGRSSKSAKLAVGLGYSKVFWFRGGWAEWVEKGLPVTK